MNEVAQPPKPDFSLLPASLPIATISLPIHIGELTGYDVNLQSAAGNSLPFTISQSAAAQFNVTGQTVHILRRIDNKTGVFLDVATLFKNGAEPSLRSFARTAGLLDDNDEPTAIYHAIVSRSPAMPPLFEYGLAMAVLIASEARLEKLGSFDGIWCSLDPDEPAFGLILPTRIHAWQSATSNPFDPNVTAKSAIVYPDVFPEATYASVHTPAAATPLEQRRRTLGRRFIGMRLRTALNECEDPLLREVLADSLEAIIRLNRNTAHNFRFTHEPTRHNVSVFAPDRESLQIFSEVGHQRLQNMARAELNPDAPPAE